MPRFMLCLCLLACTGPATDEADTGDSEEEGLIGEDVPWPDKTAEEKLSWMTYVVRPNMEALLVTHDPTYEDNFDCSTCHGTEVVSDFSTMPHPDGPPALSRSDWPSDSSDPELRAMAAFMEDEVEPFMATLLDTDVSIVGVNCGTCHEITN